MPEDQGAQEERTWEDDYPRTGLMDFIEGVLLRVALIALVILVLGQTVFGTDITSVFMSYADRLPFDVLDPQRPVVRDVFGTGAAEKALITFQLVSHPSAAGLKLLKDGVYAGQFDDGQLTLTVSPGQVLELDGTGVQEVYVVRVVMVVGTVAYPPEGKEFVVNDDRIVVGRVR